MNRILPQVMLTATLLCVAVVTLPERTREWARNTSERGDTVGFVVITAGVVAAAVAIITHVRPVVDKYLMQIQ